MALSMHEQSESSTSTERPSGLVLLPSHLFFVRSLPLPAGISPEEVASFVEVSVEQISPFALNQLYYGYYLPPEAENLVVFAAYRKQLAVYEDDEWTDADLVLPDFTSVLGLSRDGPTLVFIQDEQEVTAVYWSADSEAPEGVLSRTIDAEAGAAELDRLKEGLKRKLGPIPDGVKTLELERPRHGSIHDKNLAFTLRSLDGEDIPTEIVRPGFWTMDIRDKAFLHATRKARRQNRLLWAGMLVMFAAFIALTIFEAALFAGGKILETRQQQIRDLEPEVARIMEEEELANRLEELGGERLLPFEMLDFLNELRPPSVYFTRIATSDLRSFEVEALTPRSADVDRYQRRLEGADGLEAVEIRGLRTGSDGRTSFNIAGTFVAGAVNGRLRSPDEEEPASAEPEPEPEEVADEEADEATGSGREERETET